MLSGDQRLRLLQPRINLNKLHLNQLLTLNSIDIHHNHNTLPVILTILLVVQLGLLIGTTMETILGIGMVKVQVIRIDNHTTTLTIDHLITILLNIGYSPTLIRSTDIRTLIVNLITTTSLSVGINVIVFLSQ
jgi:hypothetical protein